MNIRSDQGTPVHLVDILWTHESKAPIVQMGESQASIKVQPVGHSVRLLMSAKMKWPSLRLEARPIGSAMMVPRIKARF